MKYIAFVLHFFLILLLFSCGKGDEQDKETFIKVLGKHHISIYAFGNEEEFMDELKNS